MSRARASAGADGVAPALGASAAGLTTSTTVGVTDDACSNRDCLVEARQTTLTVPAMKTNDAAATTLASRHHGRDVARRRARRTAS